MPKISAGDSYCGVFCEFIEEWSQFFESCNWRTFHPLMVEVEHEINIGGAEATVIVLGIGLRVRWNYAKTEVIENILDQIAAIKQLDETDGKGTPPWPTR